jgi:hypothetical protein
MVLQMAIQGLFAGFLQSGETGRFTAAGQLRIENSGTPSGHRSRHSAEGNLCNARGGITPA